MARRPLRVQCLYRDYLKRVEKCDEIRKAGGSCTAKAYRRDATD